MTIRLILVLLFGFVLIYVPIRLLSTVHWPSAIGSFEVAGIVLGTLGATVLGRNDFVGRRCCVVSETATVTPTNSPTLVSRLNVSGPLSPSAAERFISLNPSEAVR